MEELQVEVAYENEFGETKIVRTATRLKKGETRMQAVLDVVKNGFQIELVDHRGFYDFIPPGRIHRVRYGA